MTYKPTAYMPLFIQQPEAIQRGLFATSVQPIVTKCQHPEFGYQTDFFGEVVYSCTFCGHVRDERIGSWD